MKPLCGSCGQRQAQHDRLCRTCERAAGFDTRTTVERERDRLAARVRLQPFVERRQRPRIERTWPTYRGAHTRNPADGKTYVVTYEVTWDGQFGASLEDRRRW
jgi:hypothetical protein